jgi:fibrillarin-like rRNA methylase
MMFLAQLHDLTFVSMCTFHIEPSDTAGRTIPLLGDFGITNTSENYLSSVDVITEDVAKVTQQHSDH